MTPTVSVASAPHREKRFSVGLEHGTRRYAVLETQLQMQSHRETDVNKADRRQCAGTQRTKCVVTATAGRWISR